MTEAVIEGTSDFRKLFNLHVQEDLVLRKHIDSIDFARKKRMKELLQTESSFMRKYDKYIDNRNRRRHSVSALQVRSENCCRPHKLEVDESGTCVLRGRIAATNNFPYSFDTWSSMVDTSQNSIEAYKNEILLAREPVLNHVPDDYIASSIQTVADENQKANSDSKLQRRRAPQRKQDVYSKESFKGTPVRNETDKLPHIHAAPSSDLQGMNINIPDISNPHINSILSRTSTGKVEVAPVDVNPTENRRRSSSLSPRKLAGVDSRCDVESFLPTDKRVQFKPSITVTHSKSENEPERKYHLIRAHSLFPDIHRQNGLPVQRRRNSVLPNMTLMPTGVPIVTRSKTLSVDDFEPEMRSRCSSFGSVKSVDAVRSPSMNQTTTKRRMSFDIAALKVMADCSTGIRKFKYLTKMLTESLENFEESVKENLPVTVPNLDPTKEIEKCRYLRVSDEKLDETASSSDSDLHDIRCEMVNA